MSIKPVNTLKIAIAGKGGVGKTTISGTICRVLARSGDRVLAIDGDPNPNLSTVLGIDKDEAPQKSLSTDIIERVEEGEGWSFRVKMPFEEILDTYGQDAPDDVTLLIVGKPEQAGNRMHVRIAHSGPRINSFGIDIRDASCYGGRYRSLFRAYETWHLKACG